MREERRRRFLIGCRGCRRVLATVDRLRREDVRELEAHLRGCAASLPVPETVTMEDVLRRVHVQAFTE